jgi:membrane protein YqaA with SNARE-associated domain
MENSSEQPGAAPLSADGIRLWPWFSVYAAGLAIAGAAFFLLASRQGWSWSAWIHHTTATFTQTSPAVKLLGFAIYLSLCSTFLPLPTGWIVAAVATREAAVTGDLLSTVFLVALMGAVGSVAANLNDYHLFTFMLRHHRIAAVRNTRTYRSAAKWFARSPFFIVLVFNIVPIPVDVIRVLAATYRFRRLPFAVANFIGRFVRYAVIAFVTYYWNLGWLAVAALLALSAVLGGWKVAMKLLARRRGEPAQTALGKETT